MAVSPSPADTTAAQILERLAETLGGKASVSAVYGEPVTHGDVMVIPVARVGLGAGAGRVRAETGGGGGGASVTPAGYIVIKDGNAVFRPIRDPLALVPVASILAAALAPRLVRGLMRLRRRS